MRIAVLDGNSLLNRAFYGIRLLTTKEGIPTNALLGFMNMILKLREEDNAEGIIVCFDRKEPTFRHLRYDGYKAGRHAMPEELCAQMPLARELLDKFRVPRIEISGYEADDLLGTIAARNAAAGGETVVVTGDRDSLQLVGPRTTVKIMATSMGKPEVRTYDEARILTDYGVTPKQLIEVKALMGDTSDNIPGVPGIGEKTALKLIAEFGTVENLYASLDGAEMSEKQKEKLINGKESAELSRFLAEINCDVPAEINLSGARWPGAEGEEDLYEFLAGLELKSVISRLGVMPKKAAAPVQLLSVTEGAPDRSKTTAFYLTDTGCALSDGMVYTLLNEEETLNYLCDNSPKVGFDVKAAARRALDAGREPAPFAGDVMLMAYLTEQSTNLEELALDYGYEQEPEETGLLAFAEENDGSKSGFRAGVIYRLWETLTEKVSAGGVKKLYEECELPLATVLARMEAEGVGLDKDKLTAFGGKIAEDMRIAEQKVYDEAGHPFNANSPKQLGTVLFEEMGLPGGKKTKTGWSTDAEALGKLRAYPIVDALLSYRQLAKLKSTYVDALLRFLTPEGRIHTTFHQTGTATGRLSASDPNMQNMPVRNQLGGEIRRCFVPRPGCAFADADYSQIELRILAHLAGEGGMARAFREGTDIHTLTASQVFGVEPGMVTPQMRSSAKAVNFGIVYGISDFSLSEDIHVSRREAGEYIRKYFETYPEVEAYMNAVVEFTRKNGYSETLYGRRRRVRDITASNFNLRSAAERIARNTPIQGTAADVIKYAMVRVDAALRKQYPEARLLLQVHDELLAEAPIEQIEGVCELIVQEMESAAALSVKLPAEGHTGDNWLSCK